MGVVLCDRNTFTSTICPRCHHQNASTSIGTHLGDAEPVIAVVVQTQFDVFGLVGVEGEILESTSLAARRDFAVVVTVVVHVQRPDPLVSLVERDPHPDNVLGFLERVRDATAIALARPARVGRATAVPSVFGHAAVRVTSAIIGIAVVVVGGIHVNPGSHTCVNEGWYWKRCATGRKP